MRFIAHEVRHFAWCQFCAKELVYKCQSKRQEISPALVICENFVLIAVELHESIHKLPDFRNVRMKYVRTVAVDFNASLLICLASNISANYRPFLQNQYFPSCFRKSLQKMTNNNFNIFLKYFSDLSYNYKFSFSICEIYIEYDNVSFRTKFTRNHHFSCTTRVLRRILIEF